MPVSDPRSSSPFPPRSASAAASPGSERSPGAEPSTGKEPSLGEEPSPSTGFSLGRHPSVLLASMHPEDIDVLLPSPSHRSLGGPFDLSPSIQDASMESPIDLPPEELLHDRSRPESPTDREATSREPMDSAGLSLAEIYRHGILDGSVHQSEEVFVDYVEAAADVASLRSEVAALDDQISPAVEKLGVVKDLTSRHAEVTSNIYRLVRTVDRTEHRLRSLDASFVPSADVYRQIVAALPAPYNDRFGHHATRPDGSPGEPSTDSPPAHAVGKEALNGEPRDGESLDGESVDGEHADRERDTSDHDTKVNGTTEQDEEDPLSMFAPAAPHGSSRPAASDAGDATPSAHGALSHPVASSPFSLQRSSDPASASLTPVLGPPSPPSSVSPGSPVPETPSRGSLLYASLYSMAGLVFIGGDIVMSKEVVSTALKLRGSLEPWMFAIGIAFLAILLKPAYDRIVEDRYWRGRPGLFVGLISMVSIASIVTLGCLGAFRSESHLQQSQVRALTSEIAQAPAGEIDALYAQLRTLQMEVASSSYAFWSFIAVSVLFALAGAICLGIGFRHGRDWYHQVFRHRRLRARHDELVSAALDDLQQTVSRLEEALKEHERIARLLAHYPSATTLRTEVRRLQLRRSDASALLAGTEKTQAVALYRLARSRSLQVYPYQPPSSDVVLTSPQGTSGDGDAAPADVDPAAPAEDASPGN